MTDPEPLSAENRAAVKARFDKGEACQHCLGLHARACPRIKRLAFHTNGSLAEVEFWPHSKWSDDGIIWPEDLDQPPPPTAPGQEVTPYGGSAP